MIRAVRRVTTMLAAALLLGACEQPPEGRVEPPARTGDEVAFPGPRGPGVEAPPATDTAEVGPDTARAGTFYVHLRPGTDPGAFARRHGMAPTDVVEGPRPGLVARLTPDQQASLRDDPSVRSLARQIHTGGDSAPVVRTLGGDSTVN